MDAATSELLAEFPVVITLPVLWGNMDAFGHVNNTIYMRWFESARIIYGDRTGLSAMLASQRIGPILAAISCNFRRPVTYPDTVQIGAKVSRLGRSSFVMDHGIYSVEQRAIVADGSSTIVVYDYASFKPRPIPDELRAAVEDLEGKAL